MVDHNNVLGGDDAGNYNVAPYLQTAGEKRIRARIFSTDGDEVDSIELVFTIAGEADGAETEAER